MGFGVADPVLGASARLSGPPDADPPVRIIRTGWTLRPVPQADYANTHAATYGCLCKGMQILYIDRGCFFLIDAVALPVYKSHKNK